MTVAMGFEGSWSVEEASGRAVLAGCIRVAAPVVFVPALYFRLEGAATIACYSADTYYVG